MSLASRETALRTLLESYGSLAIAFSGGVDSSYLAAIATKVLGDRAVAVTGVSPSLATHDLARARRVAEQIGIRHLEVGTNELANPSYAANPKDRCYFCKDELYAVLQRELGNRFPVIADGTNADDLGDFRPGRQAAREAGIVSPLAQEGLTKSDIRILSSRLGLETADIPASPCLSSRLQTGVPVTHEALGRIEQAEEQMRRLGFRDFRVRDLGDSARVEVSGPELSRLRDPSLRHAVLAMLRFAGFAQGTIDERPLVSGRLHLDTEKKGG